MKKIFLDTNFVIDYLIRDDYKSDSERLMELGDRKNFKFYISYLSVANIAYILRKVDKSVLYSHLKAICRLFNVIKNDSKQLLNAIELQAADFEDALQYAAAKDVGCECIITRNAKDYDFSDIPVMSATEYISNILLDE